MSHRPQEALSSNRPATSTNIAHLSIIHLLISVQTSVSGLAKNVAGYQGLQLQKVVGPDEKL